MSQGLLARLGNHHHEVLLQLQGCRACVEAAFGALLPVGRCQPGVPSKPAAEGLPGVPAQLLLHRLLGVRRLPRGKAGLPPQVAATFCRACGARQGVAMQGQPDRGLLARLAMQHQQLLRVYRGMSTWLPSS